MEILSQLDLVECNQVGSVLANRNRYVINDRQGQQIFDVTEEGDCLSAFCCGGDRSFALSVTDANGQEAIRISRDQICCNCNCCPTQLVTVESPEGQIVGRVRQTPTCCVDQYQIESATGEPQLLLPTYCCNTDGDGNYPILCLNGEQIGNISKFRTAGQGCCGNASTFRIEFPADLDVNVKATLIGAMFLLDMKITSDREALLVASTIHL